MSWDSPTVVVSLAVGFALLIAFPFIETRVVDPMFRLGLFKNRMFTAANIAGFLSSMGRGGVQIMLIILLQGIWLPLHGISYQSTPFWAGVYMIPMILGFVVMGPLSGVLSDRYGARLFATLGMMVTTGTFLALSLLPYDFSYVSFAITIFIMGLGGGMFAAPNTASIMNSVPAEDRGVASGMRATLQNTGQTVSLAIFFTVIVTGLSSSLPGALSSAMTSAGVPQLAGAFTSISPTSALFSAFLGYNPIQSILSLPQLASVVSQIPQQTLAYLEGQTFFPHAIAPAFISALDLSFYIGAVLSIAAAVASILRGEKYMYHAKQQEAPGSRVRSSSSNPEIQPKRTITTSNAEDSAGSDTENIQ
jgi:MFS family permease